MQLSIVIPSSFVLTSPGHGCTSVLPRFGRFGNIHFYLHRSLKQDTMPSAALPIHSSFAETICCAGSPPIQSPSEGTNEAVFRRCCSPLVRSLLAICLSCRTDCYPWHNITGCFSSGAAAAAAIFSPSLRASFLPSLSATVRPGAAAAAAHLHFPPSLPPSLGRRRRVWNRGRRP